MTNATVKRGSWLVYLNGIEVPADSVNVTAAVGTLKQASIVFPPDVHMRRIGQEDRVRATVFYLDQYRHLVEGGEPEWRLLFDGEIVTWSWVNSAQGKQLQYVAVDFLQALGQIFPFFITGLQSMGEDAFATDGNAASATINPFAITNSLLTVGLNTGERIERPYDFVKNVIDLLIDPASPAAGQRSSIVTQWIQPWDRRTRFASRFIPSFGIEALSPPGTQTVPGIFPLWQAAQAESAIRTLIKAGDQVAGAESMYGLIQTVFQMTYYELHSHLSPPCPLVNANAEVVAPGLAAQTTQAIGPDGEVAAPVSNTGPAQRVIAEYATKPQIAFGIPPACNVFWASQLAQFTFNENFIKQPTRTYVGDPHLFNVLTKKDGQPRNPQNIARDQAMRALTTGHPPLADALLDRKLASADGHANTHNLLVYPEEFFKGPVYYNHQMPALFSYLAESQGNDKTFPRKYARYEHFRMRYMQRNGSAGGPFNPYVVQGYPAIFLDDEEANMFTWGYLTQVSHSLTQTSMSTSVGYSFGVPIDEFFETLIEEFMQYYGPTETFDTQTQEMMAPAHPVRAVRDQFQILPNAREYYHAMLWRFDEIKKDDAVVFDWTQVLGVDTPNGVVDVDVFAREESNALANEQTGEVPVYAVKNAFRRFMQNPEDAYKWSSRPICTLDEWIDFHSNGTRLEPRESQHPTQGKGARYWVKILDLEQGPGQDPGTSLDGVPCGPVNVDTRRNWEARFLRFRQKVYEERRPFRG